LIFSFNSISVVKLSALLKSTLSSIVCVGADAADVVEPDAGADEVGEADGLVSGLGVFDEVVGPTDVEVAPTDVEVSPTDVEVSPSSAGSGSSDVENASGSGSRTSRFVEVVPTASSKRAKAQVMATCIIAG
jgi:hypothetical protein